MTKDIRLKKFLADLDDTLQNYEHYDDDKQETVCTITEKEMYDKMMQNDEWHLLGSDTVESFIHSFMAVPGMRNALLAGFGVGF